MRFALLAIPTLLMLVILDVGGAAAQNKGNAAFYVAPNGSDFWSGALPTPNTAKTDGPFATVSRAQQAFRALPSLPKSAGTTVFLRGGFYSLAAPLSFDRSDSGTPMAEIVYAAYENETPILSGGTRIAGWKQTTPGRWEVTLPSVARSE